MRKTKTSFATAVHAIGAVILFSGMANTCCAQAFVETVQPPVFQRGAVTSVRISGSEVENLVGLWTSLPGVQLQAMPSGAGDGQSVEMNVSVPVETPLGLYGLRLATKSGLSNAHLFLIDELPVRLYSGTTAAPLKVSLPAAVTAPCRRAAVDRYAIDVTAGQRVSFEVVGNRFGKDYDPLVTIRDPQGRILAQCDNDAGLFFDCRFAYTFSEAGTCLVEVCDARYEGDERWNYVLRMGDFPAVHVAVPSTVVPGARTALTLPQLPGVLPTVQLPADQPRGLFFHELRTSSNSPATWIPLASDTSPNLLEAEPNDLPTDATPATFPANLHGVLQKRGDADWFACNLKKGETINVRGEAQQFGSPADLEVVLYEPTNQPQPPEGREVARNDETTSRDDVRNTTYVDDANFRFTARTDGLHRLLVRDLIGAGGPQFAYRVEIRGDEPRLELKSDFTRLTLPRGNYQPLPLKVVRTGFAGPVELSLVGAPAGVSLEPSIIPEDATEIVCRLIAANSAAEGLATLQIVGRAKKDEQAIEAVASTHPLIDRQLRNKDRILTALRNDQRRLPPSLTGRIALFITPPAPFAVELPVQELLLPKYQTADFRIVTQRSPGFAAPITFDASGGQIGEEAEERVQVYGHYPAATVETPTVTGTFFNRILTQFRKDRVDFTATAVHEGHKVTLTRTFLLDVRSAFDPQFEPATVELLPGHSVRVKLFANRVATFDGAITLTDPRPQPGLTYPETIDIPAGKTEVEVEIKANADTQPRRVQLRFESRGYVGKYEETVRSPVLTIDVKKPLAEKK